MKFLLVMDGGGGGGVKINIKNKVQLSWIRRLDTSGC